ncbi:FlgD immunoglobulin-like domain containing protein [Maribacter dokdonensis]|uniref:FlgD immunoglobulin-like domain containing protein n=2 Tax=Maribacter dokdonensis TaxID=320912 RepID=UPI003297C0ED
MKILYYFLFLSYVLNAQNYHYVENKNTAKEVQFYLDERARTSAGVYDGEVLLRTLWSNVEKDKGTHSIEWDGLDDEGLPVSAGNYTVKVLSNNVKYEWEGAKIGNTSKNLTGVNRYHGLSGFFKFIIRDEIIYWSNGYNEQRTAAYTSALSNPQVTTPVLDKGAIVKYIATGENKVFWSGHDVQANKSFVFVTNQNNNEEYSYDGAKSYEVNYSRTYESSLDLVEGTDSYITGLAYYNGYLFVARQLQNSIHVLNLSDGGALVHAINSVNAPRELTTDDKGNLWLISDESTVSKYVIQENGQLEKTILSLSSLDEPLTLGFNKADNIVGVCDGGSYQQIRFFNADNGVEGTPFGELGGYANGPKVSNNKFYFSDSKSKDFNADIFTPQYNHASLAFENDGSFWVLDTGNNRMMNYDNNRNFQDKIQYTPDWLIMSIDKNNSSRLFVDFLEYEIDYSQENVGESWILKNNWGFSIKDKYNDSFGRIREPVTLYNGKTYFLLKADANFVIAELAENGIRITNKVLDGFNWVWLEDGSLVYVNPAELSGDVIWEKYELNGFDNNEDPIFLGGSLLAKKANVVSNEPLFRYGSSLSVVILDDYKLLTFDARPEENGMGAGYHLGLLNINDNSWIFRTSKATGKDYTGDYPLDGRFDTGNEVHNAGSKAMAFGKHIIWGYYGEFWKGGFQTNQYAHYWDNGLLLNVFGTNWTKNPNGLTVNRLGGSVFTPFEGMAGNAITPYTVFNPTNSNIAYLYHPDESWHGGIHRWKISNLNSVQEKEISIILK